MGKTIIVDLELFDHLLDCMSLLVYSKGVYFNSDTEESEIQFAERILKENMPMFEDAFKNAKEQVIREREKMNQLNEVQCEKEEEIDKPKIGRIVHYVTASGVHVPGIVTSVKGKNWYCDIVVFSSNSDVLYEQGPEGTLQSYPDPQYVFGCVAPVFNVMNDESEKISGTWHWPERS